MNDVGDAVAVQIEVQTEDFDMADLYAQVRTGLAGQIGGIAMFVGLVRDRNRKAGSGETVDTLTLEHYPGMTEKSIRAIVARACQQWPLLSVVVVHRVGELAPDDQIVAVACASAHRAAAFAGAEFIMDYLKTDAVFWKKETTASGSRWIESTADDASRARAWQD